MNNILKKRITPVILASLFAGGLTLKTQAADPVITDPLKTTIGFFRFLAISSGKGGA
jgi:hypothetical protein